MFCVFTVKSIFRRCSFFRKSDGHIKKKQSMGPMKPSLSEDKDDKFDFKVTEIPLKPCSGKSLVRLC